MCLFLRLTAFRSGPAEEDDSKKKGVHNNPSKRFRQAFTVVQKNLNDGCDDYQSSIEPQLEVG